MKNILSIGYADDCNIQLEKILEDIEDETQKTFMRLVSALSSILRTDTSKLKEFTNTPILYVMAKKINDKKKDPHPEWLYNDFKKFCKENKDKFFGINIATKYASVYNMRYIRAHPWG